MLGPRAQAAGYRLHHVDEAGSTNAELLERARTGETGALWLVADRQLSGRGRNARHWVSPPGNLYASLLLTYPAPPGLLPHLSFVLSLALRDAVLAAAGLHEHSALTLKWPNDLMAGGMKTAGLLLEGGQVQGRAFVVAGFGVNIVSHPEGTNLRATHLLAEGLRLDRDSLAAVLADCVVARLAAWDRGAGFERVREDWLRVGHGIGEMLRVNTLAESFDGRFETIDSDGRLVVSTPGGRRVVSAADVFVLGPARGADAA